VPSLPWAEASSWGRVRAEYSLPMPRGGSRLYVVQPTFGSEVAPSPRTRRMTVRMHGKTWKIHRLVCEAFHGPAPGDRTRVLHGDDNGTNNRPSNLSWGTQKENLNAPGFLAYCRSRTGENNPLVKSRRARVA
jgi:hypothetical protein